MAYTDARNRGQSASGASDRPQAVSSQAAGNISPPLRNTNPRLSQPSALDNDFEVPISGVRTAPSDDLLPNIYIQPPDEVPLPRLFFEDANLVARQGSITFDDESETVNYLGRSTRQGGEKWLDHRPLSVASGSVDEERTVRILGGIGAQWSNLESANDQVEPLENYLNGLRAVHEVRDRLLEALELSQASQEHFLPIDKLESIMTFAVIRKLLQKIFPDRIKDHQEALALRICGIYGVEDPGMRRIFTILILIDKAHAVTDFVDGNVKDSDLPLKLAPKTYAIKFYKSQGASLTGSASETRLTVPKSWTESELDSSPDVSLRSWLPTSICGPSGSLPTSLIAQ